MSDLLMNEIELDEVTLDEVELDEVELETEEVELEEEGFEEEVEVEELEVEETPAPKAKAAKKSGGKAVIPTKKAAAKKPAKKKAPAKKVAGSDKPVIARKAAVMSPFGGRAAKKVIREIPQHEIMPRDVLMDHWMEFLAGYEYMPTGVKNPVIPQGLLLEALGNKKSVATGTFLAVEQFMISILQSHQVNFMSLLFRHRSNQGRINPAPNENTPRTYSPAHLSVVARKPLVELHGENLRTVPGTIDDEGNFEVNTDADAEYLAEMQERVDEFNAMRAAKAPKRKK